MMGIVESLKQFRIAALMVCLVLSLAVGLMTANAVQKRMVNESTDKLAKRIALDLPELPLANPTFNQAADKETIRHYISKLNRHLESLNHPLRLVTIQGVYDTDYDSDNENHESHIPLTLNSSRQVIEINLRIAETKILVASFAFPVFFTFLCAIVIFSNHRHHQESKLDVRVGDVNTPSKLIVDLNERTLKLSKFPETSSILSNKPLCFYLAMLKYCDGNSDATLYHNKNLPEDFIELANKYFYRLLEIGHSRRKRPDFDSNVDKMLSEIRAALDEILEQEPNLKLKFYPQKAQGEGSRSKLHNFALDSITSEDYELIGA